MRASKYTKMIPLICIAVLAGVLCSCDGPIDIFNIWEIQYAGRIFGGSTREFQNGDNDHLDMSQDTGIDFYKDYWDVISGMLASPTDVDYFEVPSIPETRAFTIRAYFFPAENGVSTEPSWYEFVDTAAWRNPEDGVPVAIIEHYDDGTTFVEESIANGEKFVLNEHTVKVSVRVYANLKYGEGVEYWLCFQKQD